MLQFKKRFLRQWLAPSLGLCCSLLMLTGCPGNNKPGDKDANLSTPVKGDWIILHELSDAEGLNPYISTDANGAEIFIKIFEPMLDINFQTQELTPILAASRPEISPDHLTYTFKLRNTIKFSDGKPLTSKDVIFSFKTIKNPLIVNAAALRNYFLDVADVVALDDYTVKVTMTKPFVLAEYFLGGLYILPKHILDPENITDQYTIAQTNDVANADNNPAISKFAKWFDMPEKNREKKYLVGSGPYVFEEWRTNETIKLRRYDNYWGKDLNLPFKESYPDLLVYKTMSDRNAAVSAMKNQDLDFMEYIPPPLFVDIDTTANPHLKKADYQVPTYMYIGWNMRKEVFSDKKTRQALSHLVDRATLIKNIIKGYGVPTNSPIYQQRPEYDKTLKEYDYNPEKAKALLAEAGWKDSDGDGVLDRMMNGKKVDFKFTFLLNAGNEARENIALLLVDEFKKVGIKAEIQKLEWSVYLENTKSHQFDATIAAWVNDPLPPDLYQIWHSSQAEGKGSNYVGFINKRADELILQSRTEFDDAKRTAALREFQQIVSDEQPYTFLWNVIYPTAYHKRIQNAKFYAVRPGYVANTWWVPKGMQKFGSQ